MAAPTRVRGSGAGPRKPRQCGRAWHVREQPTKGLNVACVRVRYCAQVWWVIVLNPSVAQLVERLTVVYAYCVSVYSEINWSPVRFRSLGLRFCETNSHRLPALLHVPVASTPFAALLDLCDDQVNLAASHSFLLMATLLADPVTVKGRGAQVHSEPVSLLLIVSTCCVCRMDLFRLF